MKVDLKIDYATYESSKYACENWHYSKCMPSSLQKRYSIGIWENTIFKGVVIIGHGANPSIGKPYNLTINECVELTRVAMRDHITPISKIISIVIKYFKKDNPGIRLIISYADSGQDHYGIIYQAGNWIYQGISKGVPGVYYRGKKWHLKAIKTSYPNIDLKKLEKTEASDKYKYLMPLDKEMKELCLKLSKPYPKRAGSVESDTSGVHPEKGGAVPTPTLQNIGIKNAK